MDPSQIAPAEADAGAKAPESQVPGQVEFDIHVKASPDELSQAAALLREAGLEDIALAFESAVNPPEGQEALDASTNELASSIDAMGSKQHGM